MIDDVAITIRVDRSPFAVGGEPLMLRYVIAREQALDLCVGRRPPDFDIPGICDWHMRRDRAEALARLIAADLAHKMLQAFDKR